MFPILVNNSLESASETADARFLTCSSLYGLYDMGSMLVEFLVVEVDQISRSYYRDGVHLHC